MSRARIILVGLLLLLPAPARADWLVMPYFGLKFAGGTAFRDLEQGADDTKNVFGASGALLGDGILGVEADFALVPGYFESTNTEGFLDSSYVWTFSTNVLLTVPLSVTREGLRPYIVGGFGALRASAHEQFDTFTIGSTMPAMTLGGGAIGMLSAKTGVRFDLRYQRTLGQSTDVDEPGGHRLSLWRATVAYVRRF